MRYLRYDLKLPLICTEVGGWSADIWGASRTRLVEVEIKKSISDLRAEFKNKKTKHSYYTNVESADSPKHFYFCFPNVLLDKAEPIIVEGFPKAGILLYSDEGQGYVYSHKRPEPLHNKTPSARTLSVMTMRMSSELATIRTTLDNVLQAHYNAVQENLQNQLDEMARLYGTRLDIEVPEEAASGRPLDDFAKRLAEAFDGITEEQYWHLPSAQRQKYVEVAKKMLTNGKEDFSEAIKK